MPDSLAATLFDAALRGMLVALLAMLAFVLLRDRPALPAARAAVALLLGLAVQVVGSMPLVEESVPRLWQAPLVAVSVGNAVLFWVFVQALFDDDFRFGPLHLAAWLGVAALAAFNCAWMYGSASVLAPVTIGMQRLVPLVFAVLATAAAAAHWRADLVERRRRLRAFIAVTGVAYTLAMLAVRLSVPHGRLTGLTATADVAMLLFIVAAAAGWMLELSVSELFPSGHRATPSAVTQLVPPGGAESPVAGPAPDPAEDALAQALLRLMGDEHVYKTEDLPSPAWPPGWEPRSTACGASSTSGWAIATSIPSSTASVWTRPVPRWPTRPSVRCRY